MVYPGVLNASVHLDPGDGTCSSADGTNCSATITSDDVYNVSLTLTNDVGPTQSKLDMFDCEWIVCMGICLITLLVFMLHVHYVLARISNCTIHVCTCHNLLTVTELNVKGEDATSVRVTLNSLCRDNKLYTVQVFFGVREEGSDDDCVPQQPVTEDILPGQSVILTVDTTTLMLGPGQEYCSTNATLLSRFSVYIQKRSL